MSEVKPYYERDGIVIYNADCRDILPTLGTFDLLLTDPPYGIGIAANPVRQAHARSDWDNQRPDRATLGLCLSMATHQIVWGGNYYALEAMASFGVEGAVRAGIAIYVSPDDVRRLIEAVQRI